MASVAKGACAFLLGPALVCAMDLRLYSEFQRIDPFGRVISADRAARSREIVSPAVVRNAFASFHVVVDVPPGTEYTIHVGQNPDEAVRATLYRERHLRLGGQWIPDTLVRVALPFTGAPAADIQGRTVDVFWLDLWVPPRTGAERVRVELQLNVGDRWIIYPMEVRISTPVVPADLAAKLLGLPLSPPAAPADASAIAALRSYVCGPTPPAGRHAASTLRKLILRNALQDLALAQKLEASLGPAAVRSAMLSALSAPDEKAWCADSSRFRPLGAESWLKLRSALWKLE